MLPGSKTKSDFRGLKFLLLVPVTMLCSFTVSAQKTWTLQASIEHAIQNNISIKQAEISHEISSINYTQSKASLLPTFNSSASYSYNFGRSIDVITNDFISQEVRSSNFSLNGNMPLFNGLQLQNSLAQSKFEFLAGGQNMLKIKNDISLNVAAAYLQVLYARESLKAANDRLISATENRNRTKLLVDAGSMAQGNLLDAEASLAAEELNVVNSENLLRNSIIAITQLLELKATEEFNVVDLEVELPEQSSLAMTPDEIYKVSLGFLPEFKLSEYNLRSAEKGLAAARSAMYPRLSLYGSINSGYSSGARRFTGETIPFDDQVSDNYNKSLGVSLSIPIFNNLSSYSGVKRSKLNLENIKYNDELTKKQVYKSVVQAHADAASAVKKYYASQKAKESAIESFNYAEKKYNVGMLSSIEFLNVRNNMSKSESDFIQAKYDLIFRVKVLDFYLGKPLAF